MLKTSACINSKETGYFSDLKLYFEISVGQGMNTHMENSCD